MAHLHVDIDHPRNVDDVNIKNIKQQEMHETRQDPAFTDYHNGTTVETDLKPGKSYVDPELRDPNNPLTWGKIMRNELCPCKSGKKYKQCHGL